MEHFPVVGHLICFDCQSLLVGESGTSSAWLSSFMALSTLAEQRELGRNLRHPPPRGNREHVEGLGRRSLEKFPRKFSLMALAAGLGVPRVHSSPCKEGAPQRKIQLNSAVATVSSTVSTCRRHSVCFLEQHQQVLISPLWLVTCTTSGESLCKVAAVTIR